MKRTVTLLLPLVLVMSLLTSCELMVPGPTERPSIGLPGEPAGTGEPAPTESAGPTVDEYGFTIFPEGNYLADPKFDTEEFLPGYDSNTSFVQQMSTCFGKALCQTGDTVYSCMGSSIGGLIMYMDKATGISAPLCGKPECLHNSFACNAYIAQWADGLCVYEGKLYWVDSRATIMRMNLDGTGRETVDQLRGSSFEHVKQDPTVFFHRGYVYIIGTDHNVVVDGVAKSIASIQAQSLDGKESFTILDRTLDSRGPSCMVKAVGNDLYIMLYSFEYEDTQNLEGYFHLVELYRWDSRTRQVEFLAGTQTEPNGKTDIERFSFQPIPGDGIYMEYYFSDRQGHYSANIYKYSFETGAFEEGKWLDGYALLFYTAEYVVAPSMEKTILLYDYGGNLLFTSAPEGEHSASTFMGVDDQFVYWRCLLSPLDEGYREHGDHYLAFPLDGGDVIVIG